MENNGSMNAPTVYLVDDDPSVLRAVTRVVRSAGWEVAAFQSPAEFLEQQDPEQRGCLVLDVTMPGLNGLELQQALARAGNTLPIIFLTGNGDIPMSVRAMKAGAVDFLSKPCRNQELLEAIAQAVEKDGRCRRARGETGEFARRVATLTAREHQVMQGVAAGQMNKQIAAELGIVVKTIKTHRGRMMSKLQVSSVAELVRLTGQLGMPRDSRP